MEMDSLNRRPLVPVRLARSDPARSTRWNLACFCPRAGARGSIVLTLEPPIVDIDWPTHFPPLPTSVVHHHLFSARTLAR